MAKMVEQNLKQFLNVYWLRPEHYYPRLGINPGFYNGLDKRSIFEAIDTLINNFLLRLEMSQKRKELVECSGAKRMVEIILEKSDL